VNVLLVPAHPGFPGQIPQSRKTVVVVVVLLCMQYCGLLIPTDVAQNVFMVVCVMDTNELCKNG